MKIWVGMVVALALAGSAQAAVKDESFKDANGARVLRESVVVDAGQGEIWAAFTVDDRFLKWSGVPVVHITPGNDGLIEFGLMPGSKIGDVLNVKNRLLVWLPDTLLVWRNEFVPAGGPFDPATFGAVRTMLALEPAGDGKTKVTETVVGFGGGAKYDQLYDHLRGGNAEYLTMLADSFRAAH